MILPIVAYGDTVLRKKTVEIPLNEDLSKLISDMFDTMYDANGVGLAAPQVGKSVRLFIVDASPFAEDEAENEEEAIEMEKLKGFKKVFINAQINKELGDEWAFKEGCLSIPGIREEVYRKEKINITFFDENWVKHTEEYDGFAARVIQHEYDHIEGMLFIDHINPLRRQLLKGRLNSISKGDVNVDYKMRFPVIKKGR
ncbi:MAG: peptide deformylase [Flavobacteriales bacterium]